MNGGFINVLYSMLTNQALCNVSPLYLKHLQDTRLKNIFAYAKTHSPIYRNKFHQIAEGKLLMKEIPVTTKYELMENFNNWVTDRKISISKLTSYSSKKTGIGNLYQGKYLLFESSGTSGIPGLFLHDLNSIYVYQALELTRRAISSITNQILAFTFEREKIAFIGALNGHYASTAAIKFNEQCFPTLQSIVRQISLYEKNETLAAKLNEYSPSIIATYPSIAIALVDLQKKGQLRIIPREIWLGGETLDANQRNYIQGNLNAKVFNSYGASEFPPIAWECDYGKLHVNTDWVILEGVDKNYNPTPVGEFSQSCLITNLSNTIQPLIRYELGDQVKFHESSCRCGNALPTIEVRGRANEIIQIKDHLGAMKTIPSIELTTFIEEHGFFNFYITQNPDLSLSVQIMGNKSHAAHKLMNIISQFFLDKAINPPKINVLKVKRPISINHSGKLHNSLLSSPLSSKVIAN